MTFPLAHVFIAMTIIVPTLVSGCDRTIETGLGRDAAAQDASDEAGCDGGTSNDIDAEGTRFSDGDRRS